MPISRIASRNSSRSSATLIASTDAPISSTPCFWRMPFSQQLDREVQRGLAADGRQHRVGLLADDDRFEHLDGQRLDVGPVGNLRVGHDRRRVAVDQDDFEPLGLERLAGLRAGVVELAPLPDDDRAGADDEDPLEISTLGHRLWADLKV